MPEIIVKDEPALPPQLTDPTVTTLLRPDQIREYEDDIRFCEESLKERNIQDKGTVIRRKRLLEEAYNKQVPHKVSGKLKDRLAARSKALLDKILPGMPTKEEMRKNPAGTVDKHMRWERKHKADIVEWKKINRMLASDDSPSHMWDTESSNLEKYRPAGAVGYGYRGDAGIPGHMAYQGIPEEQWPFDPPSNTALEQVKKRSKPQSEMSKQIQAAIERNKPQPSPEVAPSVEEEVKSESAEE